MQRLVIRARQIKALYQRELTALNRDPSLDDDTRRDHAERLWRQSTEQLSTLREAALATGETLSDDQEALFAPPRRPAYLEQP